MMKDIDIYDIKNIHVDATPRPDQRVLLDFTKKCVLNNTKFIMIDAPPGIGKSIYAVMFMDWFKKEYAINANFDVLTNSKLLQEQYTKEFDFMQSLWGKGSYHCDKYSCDCGMGQEWARLQNTRCQECPYAIAKSKFEIGDVALTNFHLFITYMVYMKEAWKRTSTVLIIDEAHEFDNVFCDFISTKISKPLLKRNGFTDEEVSRALNMFEPDPEGMTIQTYIDILDERFLPLVKTVIARLTRESTEGSMQALNNLQSLGSNYFKWENLRSEYESKPENWILEVQKEYRYNKEGRVIDAWYDMTAQPIWSYPYLEEKIWSRYDYVILMSGTILDKKLFCSINGIDPTQAEYISVDSPFPVENRPIYYFSKTGKQTFATKDIVWAKQKEVVKKILKKHKNEKGIIHTGNYELQKWVGESFQENRILTHNTETRMDVLNQHYNTDEPTVLVSPSLMIGVDLKDDYSRHQTILKMPYPNLKSKKIKGRMDTNKEWYGWKVSLDLVQSYGRSVRSVDDYANTYVLDSCFTDVMKWNSKYLPKWFLEAVKYVD